MSWDMERWDGMGQDRVNWDVRNWAAVSHMNAKPRDFILQHKTKGKVPGIKQQIFRGKLLGVSHRT